MTTSTVAPEDRLSSPDLSALLSLVRLLAREAARNDFATRCTGKADHD